jgi:hypothetical protein
MQNASLAACDLKSKFGEYFITILSKDVLKLHDGVLSISNKGHVYLFNVILPLNLFHHVILIHLLIKWL